VPAPADGAAVEPAPVEPVVAGPPPGAVAVAAGRFAGALAVLLVPHGL
jgi:hypothetical protein